MQVIGKNILVIVQEEQSQTKGGILMTGIDNLELRYKKAIVTHVGTDVSVVKNGDVVFYDRAAGHNIRLHEDIYLMIHEKDLVVVL